MKTVYNWYRRKVFIAQKWASKKVLSLAIFNLVLIILFLLRSVGYFEPFLVLSINLIIVIATIMSVALLGAGSKELTIISILFWIFAAILRIAKVDIWAERTAFYAYQVLIMVVIILFYEYLRSVYFHRQNKDTE